MSADHDRLVALFHHRWAAPILAELHRTAGSKFVTLVHHLGISRDSLRWTLQALVESGWIERNPGYGHPLRPEYILTEAGARLAPLCGELMNALRRADLQDVGLRKWSMPLIYALLRESRRFGELKKLLDGITARALALALTDLEAAGLIDRSAAYRLTTRGARLGKLLEGVARASDTAGAS